jgi:hypothetical protein
VCVMCVLGVGYEELEHDRLSLAAFSSTFRSLWQHPRNKLIVNK